MRVPAPIRDLGRFRFGLVSGIVAAIPLIRAAALEAAHGWVPVGDQAVVASRSLDVLTRDTPLLGQVSAASGAEVVHSPGPALYWLLAMPARFGPLWLQPAAVALLGLVAIVLATVITQRLAGRWASALTALALVVMIRSVHPSKLVQPINPYVGLVLLMATWFLAWYVATGRHRAHPLLVIVAGAAAQMHLTYVVPVALIVLAATALAFTGPFRDRWRGADDHGALRWFLLGGAAGLLTWAGPIVQQITGDPGNLTAILHSSGDDGARQGLGAAADLLAQTVGWPPRFITTEVLDPLPNWIDPAGTSRIVTLLLTIVVGTAAAIGAVRRRDRTATVGLVIAAVCLISVGADHAIMPAEGQGSLTLGYTMRWMLAAGAFVWSVLVIALLRSVRHRLGRDGPAAGRIIDALRWIGPVPVTVAVLLVGMFMVVPTEYEARFHHPAAVLADAAVAEADAGSVYLIDAESSREALDLVPALVYRLRRAGAEVVLGPSQQRWKAALGTHLMPSGRSCDGRFELRRPTDPNDGVRVLASVVVGPDAGGGAPMQELVLRPGDGGSSC